MANDVQTYDPLRNVITCGSLTISGYGPDSFIKITRSSPIFTTQVGAGGDVARSRSQDKTATIEITIMQTSPSNDQLSALAKADEIDGSGIFPFQMKDLNSTTVCSAQSAWVESWPDMERAKETGVCVWKLAAAKMNTFIGGGIS